MSLSRLWFRRLAGSLEVVFAAEVRAVGGATEREINPRPASALYQAHSRES
jgi:hypothetical protein